MRRKGRIMLISLAFVFICALVLAALCRRCGIPALVGMIFTGIILGPHVLNLLDVKLLALSPDLRKIALLIILLKAGLSLDLVDLRKVGKEALLLSFLPALFEITAYTCSAHFILGLTYIEAALLGCVLSAVSPAVTVPRMLRLLKEKYGSAQAVPQMVMAAASLDDIVVLVLFSSFMTMAGGGNFNYGLLLTLPAALAGGVATGLLCAFLLATLFKYRSRRGQSIRNSVKVLIIMACACALQGFENVYGAKVPFSALLAILSMACAIKFFTKAELSTNLAVKFDKLWIVAEIILFVMVGAALDWRYALNYVGQALAVLLFCLLFRAFAVLLCVAGSNLNYKERFFVVLAYMPKATVQAAIGGVPLAAGLSCGNVILSVAVWGILLTAPLGALAIDGTYRKLLRKDDRLS